MGDLHIGDTVTIPGTIGLKGRIIALRGDSALVQEPQGEDAIRYTLHELETGEIEMPRRRKSRKTAGITS